MSWSDKFVELDKSKHDRESFSCGESELDTFIQKFALKHMSAGISRTMVLPAKPVLPNNKLPISAFYTIAPSSICRDTLPELLAKKLPRYPIPVFLLAQLSVHSMYQGCGLGKVALIKALQYLWQVNSYIRAYAVVVDCLNENAESFYLKYGFEYLCEHNGRKRLFLPMKTIEQLFNS